jgi:hypothetical protein
MGLKVDGTLKGRGNAGEISRSGNECLMFMVSHGMQRIYELLAFVVALYFPVALLAWLVIDKFFATGDGKGHVVRQQPGQRHRNRVLADRSRPGA